MEELNVPFGKEKQMEKEYTEKDWKLFQSKVPGWQETYMDRLNHEYISILSEECTGAADKFWTLCDRIKVDQRHKGVIMRMSRSKMVENLVSLIMEEAITMEDLEGFSDELQKSVKSWVDFYQTDWSAYEECEEEE